MFIIFRWWYFLGLTGVGLAGFGAVEMNLSLQCGAEPLPLAVAALEQGLAPTQPFVKLGEHVALFPHAAWSERKGRLERVCYPIVSRDHPYLQAWDRLRTKYGDTKDVPKGEVPPLDGVRVFVQTKSFSTRQQVPDSVRDVAHMEGTMFAFAGLAKKEQALVTRSLPRLDAARVLVLEEGRRPRPLVLCVLMIVAGVVALWGAVVLYRRPARQ